MTQRDSFDDAGRVRIVPSEPDASGMRDVGTATGRTAGRPASSDYEVEARAADRDWRSSDTSAEPGVMRPSAASTSETTAEQAARARSADAGPHYDGNESTDEIRHDIERTRAEMSGTIDAIQARLGAVQERLSPHHLVQEAKDKVREATVGRIEDMAYQVEDRARDTGMSVVDTIKANPIPAALVAFGAAMLWRNRRSSHSSPWRGGSYDDRVWDSHGNLVGYRSEPRLSMGGHRWEPDRGPVGNVQHQTGEWMGRAGDRMSDVGSRAQDTMSSAASNVGRMAGDAASSAGDMASNVASSAGDMASTVASTAGEMASNVADTAGDLASNTGYQMRRAQSTLGRMLEENPLAVGAVALGAGIAIGLALPETDRENEMMGETRDNLMDKAQDVFEDTKDKASRVASEAQRAAMDEAHNQGLATS